MRWVWEGGSSDEFEDQTDAETWLAEHWREIDAESVTLADADSVVYEMSLREEPT